MKMRTLLCGILLGFFTLVESTTIQTHVTKTQNVDDDVLTEAVKDGYIVRQTPPPSPTSPTSTSAPLLLMMDLLSHESSGDSESGSGDLAQFEEKKTVSFTMKTLFESELEGSGSETGSGLVPEIRSDIRAETRSRTRLGLRPEVTSVIEPKTGSVASSKDDAANQLPQGIGAKAGEVDEHHKGHGNTPGWIIIVAFVVGVAALVLLCVAIATREKWNGPARPQSSAPVQPRETEMHTLLNAKSPVENGKDEEYTVIPLEELPYKYSEV